MEQDLKEMDVPGSHLDKPFEAATNPELKRWLKCRNASTSGKKCKLVERCKIYAADPSRSGSIVDPDGDIWRATGECSMKENYPNKENIKTGGWTKCLEGLPNCFGEGKIYEHIGGKTEKHRVAGYNMYKCKKVENLLVYKRADINNSFEVKGIVGASYSKERYKASFRLDQTGTVVNAHCFCKAGATGACKHVAALLFQLNDFKQSGAKEIEEDLACTEKPRQWGVKKLKTPLISQTFDKLNFVKYAPGKTEKNIGQSNCRREYSCLPAKRNAITSDRLIELANNLSGQRSMWSKLILEAIIKIYAL